MIIVTGATGQLGRQIVESLLARMPAEQIGISVRDPHKALPLAEKGVRVRRGSFADPESLAHAFKGASQVLIVSVDKFGEEAVEQHRTAITAAVAAGARRVLYTSHMGASPTSYFQACRDHAAAEEALAASGVPYTALRNGYYASSALMFLGQAMESGQLVLPEDGPISWTGHADLADAAAAILTDEGRFDGTTPPLTGAQALTFTDLVKIASKITGRVITRIIPSDDQYREQMAARGVAAGMIEGLMGIFIAARTGEFAAVDPTLTALIGREPTPMGTVLSEKLSSY